MILVTVIIPYMETLFCCDSALCFGMFLSLVELV